MAWKCHSIDLYLSLKPQNGSKLKRGPGMGTGNENGRALEPPVFFNLDQDLLDISQQRLIIEPPVIHTDIYLCGGHRRGG